MKNSVYFEEKEINYTLVRRKGTRSIRVFIRKSGELVLSMPSYCPTYLGKTFLEKNIILVDEWLKKFAEKKKSEPVCDPLKSYSHCKSRARKLIHERVKVCNEIYKYSFNKIAIKDHCTRWGSCSGKKNLNFNYRLVFLPLHLVDYVVVHELCHLKEMNHSARFWSLVAKSIPDYRKRRLELKRCK